jgi:CubicO group peptidase (beta-lactamase class C family)
MVNPEKITQTIKKHSDPEPFSGVVYLSREKNILYQQGFGYAIRSEKIPNKVNTRFQTASGCKIFTSVAICKLIERGKLAFDSLLSDCVDIEFPKFSPEITIRHLLTHSSGITSYFEEDINPDYEALWQDLPQYRVRAPKDFLPLFQHKPMKFSPGERFEYNDGGYILLGIVIENVSGKKFIEYIQEEIFLPAGMKDSGYFATDQLPERTAYAYIKNGDGSWRTNFFAVPIVGAPDGGAYVTAPDMVRFWNALSRNEFFSSEMTKELLAAQIPTSWKTPYTHYGYGVWQERQNDGMKKYFVEGYDPGVAFRSVVYPEEKVVLTVIGNTADALWSLYDQLEEKFELK